MKNSVYEKIKKIKIGMEVVDAYSKTLVLSIAMGRSKGTVINFAPRFWTGQNKFWNPCVRSLHLSSPLRQSQPSKLLGSIERLSALLPPPPPHLHPPPSSAAKPPPTSRGYGEPRPRPEEARVGGAASTGRWWIEVCARRRPPPARPAAMPSLRR